MVHLYFWNSCNLFEAIERLTILFVKHVWSSNKKENTNILSPYSSYSLPKGSQGRTSCQFIKQSNVVCFSSLVLGGQLFLKQRLTFWPLDMCLIKRRGKKIEACRSDFRGKSGVRGCHFSSQRLELLPFLVPNFNRTSAGCCFKTHFKKKKNNNNTYLLENTVFLTDVAPFRTSVVTVCVPGPQSSLLHTATTLLHKVNNWVCWPKSKRWTKSLRVPTFTSLFP